MKSLLTSNIEGLQLSHSSLPWAKELDVHEKTGFRKPRYIQGIGKELVNLGKDRKRKSLDSWLRGRKEDRA